MCSADGQRVAVGDERRARAKFEGIGTGPSRSRNWSCRGKEPPSTPQLVANRGKREMQDFAIEITDLSQITPYEQNPRHNEAAVA